MSIRPPSARDPLAGTDRLLIDGTNLLHAMARRPDRAPAAALVGRLRAVVPPGVGVEIVFDGAPERGMRGERVASGVSVRHAGPRTADDLLLALVEGERTSSPDATSRILVVTDDRELRARLRARGARTAGCAWLLDRLEGRRLSAPSVGNARPPRGSGGDRSRSAADAAPPIDGQLDDDERPRWKPGRGATTKRGNPRRGRTSSGRMPS